MKNRLLYVAEETLETILFYIDLVYKGIEYVTKRIRGIRYQEHETHGHFTLRRYHGKEV